MASEEVDLTKLKVPELKQMLKERGLPSSGNKAELLQRLEEALDGDDDDLGDQELEGGQVGVAGGEASDTEDVTDDILNDDDQETDAILSEEPVVKTQPPVTATTSVEAPKEAGGDGDAPTRKVIKFGDDTSAEERLAARAAKFGTVSEDARKQARAQRFGITEKSSASTAGATGPNYDQLKKRAERFGAVTSTSLSKVEEVEKLKKRAERFGSVTSTTLVKTDEKEKILKRKQRFGEITGPSAATTSTGSLDDAKKKRAERFGLITA